MNKKGQMQLEAIICFSAFLAITALMLSAANNAGNRAKQATDALKAKAQAETCCLAADSLYTSNAQQSQPNGLRCTAEANLVESRSGQKTKESQCLAKEIRLTQKASQKTLEVKTDGHYR